MEKPEDKEERTGGDCALLVILSYSFVIPFSSRRPLYWEFLRALSISISVLDTLYELRVLRFGCNTSQALGVFVI